MTGDRLAASLRDLVREHGLERVSRSLQEIGAYDGPVGNTTPGSNRATRPSAVEGSRRKSAITALERVGKLDLPEEIADIVMELARKFDEKSFMPTFADIADFCRAYNIDEPSSKSRASAIPRVFRTIAVMELEDIQMLLDYGAFSGPARLGPIADAIARNSRARVEP